MKKFFTFQFWISIHLKLKTKYWFYRWLIGSSVVPSWYLIAVIYFSSVGLIRNITAQKSYKDLEKQNIQLMLENMRLRNKQILYNNINPIPETLNIK